MIEADYYIEATKRVDELYIKLIRQCRELEQISIDYLSKAGGGR